MCLKHIGRSQFESEAAWAWETVQLEQKSWNQCYHIELFTQEAPGEALETFSEAVSRIPAIEGPIEPREAPDGREGERG